MPKKAAKKPGRQRKGKSRSKPTKKTKKRGPPFKKRTPPPVEKIIEQLASYFCTDDEISAAVDIPKRTMQRNYGAHLKKGRQGAAASLKRRQFETAMGLGPGSTTMQIWLGKVYLGQKEMREPPPPDEDTTYIYETQWGTLDESADEDS